MSGHISYSCTLDNFFSSYHCHYNHKVKNFPKQLDDSKQQMVTAVVAKIASNDQNASVKILTQINKSVNQ